MTEVKESDWKLFRKKIPVWQENYMEKLCREYIDLLSSDGNSSDHFWELEKRIKEDQKSPGVIVEMRRSNMYHALLGLLTDNVITLDDLSEFSEDLQERMKFLSERW